MKQPEKCEDCAKNWQNKHKIEVQELKIALADCNACIRNNFVLYSKSTGGGTAGKEK